MRYRLLAAICLAVTLSLPLDAQQATGPAVLVADSVQIDADGRLVASGAVEILQDGTRLTATQVIYSGDDDSLQIAGPIRIAGPDGDVLLASEAALDQSLRDGILKGARLVLDQQLQLAAVEARQVGGRYTQLSKVAVTSCQVCGPDGVPLWQIRARRVVHDDVEKQLYFDHATFQVGKVPVLYLPRLRMPDPTVQRARGFLIPTVTSSSRLGFGIRVPYFIPIGDHQDLTLTPYLSPKTRTVDLRYRRAFARGDLEITGALSNDSLTDDSLRGYLFAEGGFALERGFMLDFAIKTVSDPSYLSDYNRDTADRLDSTLSVTRVRRNERTQAALVHYESLRDDEENDTQPTIVLDLRHEQRFFPAALAGELRLGGLIHGHLRNSSRDTDGPDADTEVDGRDVARLGVDASWRNRWTLPGGLRAGAATHLWIDRFAVYQDASSDQDTTSVTPGAALELRLPMARTGPQGGRTLLEPVLQYGWVGGERPDIANDESTRVEFDEANLLSLVKFPAADRRARGESLAAALRLLHESPEGWQLGATVGRVWQSEASPDFTPSSGLDSDTSDWLVAAHFEHPDGLHLSTRGLVGSDARISKAEASLAWHRDALALDATYLLLPSDAEEGRDDAQSEWTLAGRYDIDRHWQASATTRYDLSDQRLDRFGLGLRYQNECVDVAFSASRRYAESANVAPSTDYDLTVALKGFGTGGSGKEFRRTCPQ